ncbi:MAG: putative metal-dependent enzyme (double-stranded beta helix superfamily) [Gammaproteobacteria bacterium]|jgi:predicted metal-dependent enzyme (double-stranded beta helix superfamily)
MFSIDNFIEDCRTAVSGTDPHQAVQALVERAVSDPTGLMAGLGEPKRAGVNKLYVSDDLTVLNLIWGPQMILMPHNHEMWAAIGIYTGREDNMFWRRLPEDENGKLKAAGARSLEPSEVAALGPDAIHSVCNPLMRLTGALHVYGGNFFETPRSEWDPENLHEGTYDVAKNLQLFEDSNRRLESA